MSRRWPTGCPAHDVYAITTTEFWNAFWGGIAIATAAAFVAGVVALFRFIRRTDAHRIATLEEAALTAEKVERRQNHVIRWARAVGRKVGIPFPLDDGSDDPAQWHDEDEGNQ